MTPKHAGGIGLVDVAVAVKYQRIKHAVIWINYKEDIYFAAWQTWAFRGEPETHAVRVYPDQVRRQKFYRRIQSPRLRLEQKLG